MASDHETIFTMEATPVKFGAGASDGRRMGAQAPRASSE